MVSEPETRTKFGISVEGNKQNLLPQLLNHKLSVVKFFTLDDLALRVHGQDLLNEILIYSSSDAMEREMKPTFKYLIRSSSR